MTQSLKPWMAEETKSLAYVCEKTGAPKAAERWSEIATAIEAALVVQKSEEESVGIYSAGQFGAGFRPSEHGKRILEWDGEGDGEHCPTTFPLYLRGEKLEDQVRKQVERDTAAQIKLSSISSQWKLGCVKAEAERDRYREALERIKGLHEAHLADNVEVSAYSLYDIAVVGLDVCSLAHKARKREGS